MKKIRLIILLFIIFFLSAIKVEASEIFFRTKNVEVGLNSKIEVKVYLNSADELVNAVESEIIFPSDFFDLDGFYTGGSVLSLWVGEPTLSSSDTVSFAGIVPGGFNDANGYLFSMILTAKKDGVAVISANNERILLNDGLGSPSLVTKSSLTLNVNNLSVPQDFVPLADATPPDSFEPKISKDNQIFDGRAFLSFVSQDKGTGIYRYEVKEVLPMGSFSSLFKKGAWRTAESPYLLQDQTLKSFIYVKAVDWDGNERIVQIRPVNDLIWYENYLIWTIFALTVIVLFVCSLLLKTILIRKKA